MRALWILSMGMLTATAHADVVVRFVEPERYVDAADAGSYGAEASRRVLRELERYLVDLGARTLAPDQTLRIEVLDIDLAGRYEPWRSASQRVRILTDITWPRFKLRYALNQAGVTLREGEDTLTDLNYLRRTAAFSESDPLRYEKALLADWVRSVTGAR